MKTLGVFVLAFSLTFVARTALFGWRSTGLRAVNSATVAIVLTVLYHVHAHPLGRSR